MTESDNLTQSLPLEAIHLPPAPGFWPVAWGWWCLFGAIIVIILAMIVATRRRKHRLKPKKAAIAMLTQQQEELSPAKAMKIVRQAVLSYYPREHVAHLSGSEWLAFLDSQVNTPLFSPSEQTWLTSLYRKEPAANRDELIAQCHRWLNTALPPKNSHIRRAS